MARRRRPALRLISLKHVIRHPALLMLFASVCVSLPIVAYPWFPTQDGPAHLNTAVTLRWLANDPGQPPLSEIFAAHWSLSTNQLSALLLSRLTAWLPVETAEKLLLITVVQAFVAVAFWGVGRIAPANLPLALLPVPLAAGYLLHMGFYNFIMALPLAFASMVYLHLRFPRFTPGHAMILALLVAATYFAHVIACVLLIVAAGAFCVTAAFIDGCQRGQPENERVGAPSPLRRSLLGLLACLPAGLLVLRDFGPWLGHFEVKDAPVAAADAPALLLELVKGANLMVYSALDGVFEVTLAAVFATLAAIKLRSRFRQGALAPADAWLAAALALLVGYVCLPWHVEDFFQQRLVACLLLVLSIWLADHAYRTRTIAAAAAVLLVLNGGLASWRLWWIGESKDVLAEYAAVADQLPERTSIVSFTAPGAYGWKQCFRLDRSGSPCRVRPHLNFLGKVIGNRAIANLGNYQAALGYFPLRFTAAAEHLHALENLAYKHEIGWDSVLAEPAEMQAVRRALDRHRTARVLFWDDPTAGERRAASLRTLEGVLGDNYHQVWTSRPRGLVRLYARTIGDDTSSDSSGRPSRAFE